MVEKIGSAIIIPIFEDRWNVVLFYCCWYGHEGFGWSLKNKIKLHRGATFQAQAWNQAYKKFENCISGTAKTWKEFFRHSKNLKIAFQAQQHSLLLTSGLRKFQACVCVCVCMREFNNRNWKQQGILKQGVNICSKLHGFKSIEIKEGKTLLLYNTDKLLWSKFIYW